MLTSVEKTARWTTGRIMAIRDLFNVTAERCRSELQRPIQDLIELIFYQPYCKIAFLIDAGIAKRKAASQYLQELERIGILVSEKARP